MVLKLAPGVPLVWRTPSSVQFGVDAPVVVEGVTAGVERILAALRTGVSVSGFDMLARDAGVPVDEARDLLERLAPAMHEEAPPASGRVLVAGEGPIATLVAGLLREAGVLASAHDTEPTLAVLVAAWVLGPDDAARWLRRDVPHLPVVATDTTVNVGPFVEPGGGPCVYCLQLARTDADPCWPAVATQLWGRDAPSHPQLMSLSVASFVARRVIARLASGPSPVASAWRIADRGGTVSAWTARTHPQCSCAAPPESDWAPGSGRASPVATSSLPGGAGHG